jgi:bacteriocin biosynthesis cyclodehydratase domain-containing protein
MISQPCIKAKYHIEIVPEEGIYLLSETDNHVLEGPALLEIVPLLDGATPWETILDKVAPSVGRDAALAAFGVLTANSHVAEGSEANAALQSFWGEFGTDADAGSRIVASTPLHVATVGTVEAEIFRAAAADLGFPLVDADQAALTLVLTDDYQSPAIADINARHLARGTPWALVKPVGLIPLVGPFFRPFRTACWACLETRLRHNREVESYLQRRTGRTEPFPTTRARTALGEMQAASIALLQILRWLATGSNASLESRIVALDITRAEQVGHAVLRRPQCPACGDPALASRGGAPLILESRTGSCGNENGTRFESPEETYQRYLHHVSPLTGLVRSVLPSQWNAAGPLRSYVAGHNFALKNNGLYFLKDGLRTSSAGKGWTDAQARASALCEALERFSGVHRGEEEKRSASLQRLGDEGVDPRSAMLFSESQYADREAWLQRGSRFQVIPLPFDPGAEISWSPIWSWTERRRKYLPTSYLYYGFEEPVAEHFFCWADSNGNAAGACMEDAILQGFLELVERDAVCLWWYNRVARPGIDPAALDDPRISGLQAFYAARDREFWLLDLTSDLGIPVCAAICRRKGGPAEDIVLGFGAHLDPRIAVSRAITEMNQFMPAVLAVAPTGETYYAYHDGACLDWWKTGTLANQPYIAPAGWSPGFLALDPADGAQDVRDQILGCFEKVERKGLEVLVLDQTRPDVGTPVAKVIVPGLRHFWARWAPGRLYDAPVEAGWQDHALTEDELNPIPMFV